MTTQSLPTLPAEFHTKRMRMAMLLVAALLFVALGVFLYLHPDGPADYDPDFVQFVAIACVLFFGFCTLAGIKALIKPRMVCALTQDGIDLGGKYFIAWDEIDLAKIVSLRGQRFVGIFLKDKEAFYRRQGAVSLRMMEMNDSLVGTPMTINTMTIGIAPQVMCDWINGLCGQRA